MKLRTIVLSSLGHLFSDADLYFRSVLSYSAVFERRASNPSFHLFPGVVARRIQSGKKRQEAIHEPLEGAEGRLPLSHNHLRADSRRIVDPRLLTGLEHPPAFPNRAHRLPENVKHSGTDDPIEGLLFESQVGGVPHFKMDSCGVSGPESIGPGHPNQNAAQIDPDDSDMRRSLHYLNGEVARPRAKIKEKALMESGKDFLGDLTVITLDDESGGFFIKRSQRAGNPLYGESSLQSPLRYALG